MTERLVVVGGDAAGMSAASQARPRRGPDDLEIVAFERGSTTSYSACGIPYWIGDVVSDRNRLISRHPATFGDSFAIDVRIRTEVEEINLDRREVRARDLETGSTYAVGFDALLGGTGYIGIELAEALTVRGLDVMLVEMAPEPMSTLDPDLGAMVRTAMNGLGITIHSGERVEAIETGHGKTAAAVVTDQRIIPTDLVVLGLGVRPNVALAQAAASRAGRPAPSSPTCGCVPRSRVSGINLGGGYATFPGVVGTAVSKGCSLEIARTGLKESECARAGFAHVTATVKSTTRAGCFPGATTITTKLIAEKRSGR